MADVKWIKITTDIFDDEKIVLIESLPDAYAIITVWFKLLCLAGKQNNSGVFLIGKIAYTDKMLATIFRMKETTVQLALKTFESFGMIEIIDGVITIPNWNKHQSLDAYEKKKERDRLYQAERRANQKALIAGTSDKSFDASPDKSSYVAVSEEDKEKEEDKERDNSLLLGANNAPSPKASNLPAVISISLNDNSEYPITQPDIDGWAELYPAVNIMQELRKMKGWADANPKKRKTKGGIKRFINSWLAKEQDKYHPPIESYKPSSNAGSSNIFLDMLNERGGTP